MAVIPINARILGFVACFVTVIMLCREASRSAGPSGPLRPAAPSVPFESGGQYPEYGVPGAAPKNTGGGALARRAAPAVYNARNEVRRFPCRNRPNSARAKPAMLKDKDFVWEDPLDLEGELSEEERMVRDTARGFAQDYLKPRVIEALPRRDLRCAHAARDGQARPARADNAGRIWRRGPRLRCLMA